MATILAEFDFDAPTSADVLGGAVRSAAHCFTLHRVTWQDSRLTRNGRRLLARFDAPDAESVRIAMHRAGLRPGAVWAE